MNLRRRIVVIPAMALTVLAGASLVAWRTGWPPSVFGSPSVRVQTQVAHATAISANSGTWYPVAKDAYVNDLTAWNNLPVTLRASSLGQLRTAERRFRAMGAGVMPQRPLVTVRRRPSPAATGGGTAALRTDSHAVLLAAHSGNAPGLVSADFGASGLRANPLSFDPSGVWGWTPCVSITPPRGRTIRLCGGIARGFGDHSPQVGMTENVVETIGEAAAQAYVPATATYTNQTSRAQKLLISGSVASVSMTLDKPSLSAAGCNWSKVRYDTPATGALSTPLPNPPLIDIGTCSSSFSVHIPLPPAYAVLLDRGMAAAHNIVNAVSDAYSTVVNKSQLTSAPALQACASGQILSDLSAFFTDFGGIGAPTCQPTPLPTWTGTLGPGQTIDFSFTPTTWAVDGGAGVEATGLFSFIHLHIASASAQAPPALYVHNGIVLGSLFKPPHFPATIGLDNHDFLSGLHWAPISSNDAAAQGTLNVDNCTPSCASGTTVQYPIELIASNPQHCTVAVYKPYSTVSKQEQAYVFNKIQLKALSGNPPSSLVGSTPTLPPACNSPPTPVPVPVPTPPSPTQPSPPKTTTVTVTIPANGGWVDTGLSLSSADSVDIKASGSWTPDGVNYAGPDGFGQSLLSADNYINLSDLGACADCATTMYPDWAALMSYTGSNPPQPGSYTSTSVAPQAHLVDYVGSGLTTTKFWPYTGELWLGINDDAYSANTSDNSGQVTATITVTRP